MRNKKKVPTIRFKGFTEEWVSEILGELSEPLEYGLNAPATTYDGINKYIRITDIEDDTHLLNDKGLTSPKVNLSLSARYQLRVGDILFARTGASVGKSYRYKEIDGLVYYAGFLIRARIKSNVNSEFVFQNTLTNKYDKFVKITSQRSGQPGINAQEYGSWSLMLPKLTAEQQVIGNYFQSIDRLINTSHTKLNKLKSIKKACLEKMFPRNGSNIPELRFRGFMEEWEEKKIEEIAYIIMGQSPCGKYYTNNPEDHILVQGNADMKNGVVAPRVWTTQVTKTAEIGDIIMSVRAPVGDVGKTYYNIVIGRGVAAIRGNEFLFQVLKKINSEGFWKQYSAGSTFESINSEAIRNAHVLLTTEKEQIKVGRFLKNIDDLITKKEKQINKLKNIKKACLDKMFVNTED